MQYSLPKRCDNCFAPQPVYKHFNTTGLGEHEHWEVSLNACKACDVTYLRAFLESDGYPRSGRWYQIEVERGLKITAAEALARIASEDLVYYGGSYYDSTGTWSAHRPHAFDLKDYC